MEEGGFEGESIETANLMLGVKRDNRDSVHGSRKLLGAEHWVGGTEEFAHSKVSNTHTRLGGQLARPARTIFDN
jgi:hypothetical protein